MEQAVQVFALVHLTTMGVSHILQPRVWVDFFVRLREWGRPGVFVVGFMSLYFGSIIVAFHNVWQGIPMLVTLLGWAQVVKALIYFAFPAVGMKGLRRIHAERSGSYVVAGAVLLALAAAIAYHLIAG